MYLLLHFPVNTNAPLSHKLSVGWAYKFECFTDNLWQTKRCRVIFTEDHIPLLGGKSSKWSLWNVVFHEINSMSAEANRSFGLFYVF